VNESEALALVMAVQTQDGRSEGEWQVTPVDDLGWIFGAIGVRSNCGYAVTTGGRVGSFPISTTRARDALQELGSLPDPSDAGVDDAAQALSLLELSLTQLGDIGQSGWRHADVGGLGWLFTPTGVESDIRFVVTRSGRAAVCPAHDATGAATVRELTDRAARRIPVAQLNS
jgi:hypothetical protein